MCTHTHTRSPLKQTCYYECAESSGLLFPPQDVYSWDHQESLAFWQLYSTSRETRADTHMRSDWTHTHTYTKEKGHPKLIQALKKSNEIKPFVPLYYCQCETAVVTCLCKNMDLIIPMHGYHRRYKSIKSSVLHSYTQCFFTTIFFLNLWLIPLTFTLLWEALSFRAA